MDDILKHQAAYTEALIEPMAVRIANVITRMIVGGPQQVSLLAAEYYRGRPGFEYHLVCGEERGTEGDYHVEMRNRGISTHPVANMVREVRLITDAKGLVSLYRLFRRLRPQLVHCRSAKARFLGPIAARMAGVPVVAQTVHGWSFNNAVDERKPFFVRLERMARSLCDCTVFVSEQDFAEGVQLGIVPADARDRGRSAIIRSGIDLSSLTRASDAERARVRREAGVDDGQPIVSLVQRLSPPKTPLTFVAAMARLVESHPDAVALIVGDGPLRHETEAAAGAAGLSARVRFLGVRKDIPAVLSASTVVVHSSIREGLPRVVLEALAVGTPVVATNVGGVPEVARHGDNALVVPPEDPTALAAALDETLRDPAAAARRADRGREAVYPFSAQRMLDEQHRLYEGLLGARGIRIPDAG